jgi:hypothetical protein
VTSGSTCIQLCLALEHLARSAERKCVMERLGTPSGGPIKVRRGVQPENSRSSLWRPDVVRTFKNIQARATATSRQASHINFSCGIARLSVANRIPLCSSGALRAAREEPCLFNEAGDLTMVRSGHGVRTTVGWYRPQTRSSPEATPSHYQQALGAAQMRGDAVRGNPQTENASKSRTARHSAP